MEEVLQATDTSCPFELHERKEPHVWNVLKHYGRCRLSDKDLLRHMCTHRAEVLVSAILTAQETSENYRASWIQIVATP